MKNIPITPEEFAGIRAKLKAADPQDIKITELGPGHGNLEGHRPLDWSASYFYADGVLKVVGHGIFLSARVERGIEEKVQQALITLSQERGGK